MLRPASSSGVYIRMSGACSTVSSMVKRGAISTMPPTLAAAMMAITNPIAERSSLRWKSSGIRHSPGTAAGTTGMSASRGAASGADRTVIQML